MTEPILKDILGWIIAAVILGSAGRMIFHKNVMRSAVYLAITLVGTAGLFFLLFAEFVGISQLLVYAGAVIVLVLIAVMASTKTYVKMELTGLAQTGTAAVGVIALAALMVYLSFHTAWNSSGLKPYVPVKGGDISPIGEGILIQYVLAFELASFILLGALIGAVVLIRKEPEDDP